METRFAYGNMTEILYSSAANRSTIAIYDIVPIVFVGSGGLMVRDKIDWQPK
jgi:hypothetical protein